MKVGIGALAVSLVVASNVESSSAFQPHSAAFVSSARSFARPSTGNSFQSSSFQSATRPTWRHSSLSMSGYSVGIVGATGAVGKEIRSCLETRKFPVERLRIFGSERSAGNQVETSYGTVTVELFSQEAARECDVCFLAVNGDFSLEHAEALTKGDGCVVIDNSVRIHNGLDALRR